MARILIPTPLRKFTNNADRLDVEGATVADALEALARAFPQLEPHLFDEQGRLRSFIRVYVGEDDIATLQGEATPVEADTVLSIVPAIAGGATGGTRGGHA